MARSRAASSTMWPVSRVSVFQGSGELTGRAPSRYPARIIGGGSRAARVTRSKPRGRPAVPGRHDTGKKAGKAPFALLLAQLLPLRARVSRMCDGSRSAAQWLIGARPGRRAGVTGPDGYSPANSIPQLITSVGCSRMIGPVGSPSGPAASGRACALPRISTHRGRHGGSTSSTTRATFGLRCALRNFRVRASPGR
jgi:hypothetical protein